MTRSYRERDIFEITGLLQEVAERELSEIQDGNLGKVRKLTQLIGKIDEAELEKLERVTGDRRTVEEAKQILEKAEQVKELYGEWDVEIKKKRKEASKLLTEIIQLSGKLHSQLGSADLRDIEVEDDPLGDGRYGRVYEIDEDHVLKVYKTGGEIKGRASPPSLVQLKNLLKRHQKIPDEANIARIVKVGIYRDDHLAAVIERVKGKPIFGEGKPKLTEWQKRIRYLSGLDQSSYNKLKKDLDVIRNYNLRIDYTNPENIHLYKGRFYLIDLEQNDNTFGHHKWGRTIGGEQEYLIGKSRIYQGVTLFRNYLIPKEKHSEDIRKIKGDGTFDDLLEVREKLLKAGFPKNGDLEERIRKTRNF